MNEWLKDPAVDGWLRNLAPSSQRVQVNYFKHFIKWIRVNGGNYAEATPSDLVEHQKTNRADGREYELLDKLVKPFIRSKEGTYHTKNARYSNIRSFFLHNRAELPQDPTFNVHPEREPNQGTLTADEIKQVILNCNTMYQAIYLSMFQAAMDQEMFTYWNTHGWDNLHTQLREDPEVIKIDLPGRKSQRNKAPYYTFIGRDAIDKIRAWLKIRAERVQEGKIPESMKAIFISQFGNPITKRSLKSYWLKRLRMLNLVDPVHKGKRSKRTGKGLHEMRDVFRSLWSKSKANHLVGEYCMGHTIDKLEYDKSFRDIGYYRNKYLEASSHLNLITSYAPYGLVENEEVSRLQRQVQRLEAENKTVTVLETKVEELQKKLDEKNAEI